MIIIDTDVISEIMRVEPDPRVLACQDSPALSVVMISNGMVEGPPTETSTQWVAPGQDE